jgi:F-box and leucine-rich repeat protein GRR1
LSLTGVQAFLHEDLTAFCREAPPEFTHQQREVFCVFSGEGVNRLRAYLNRERIQYDTEGTMYDDAEEEGDGENAHMTGLMAATAITDEDEEMGEDGEGDEDGTGGGGPD